MLVLNWLSKLRPNGHARMPSFLKSSHLSGFSHGLNASKASWGFPDETAHHYVASLESFAAVQDCQRAIYELLSELVWTLFTLIALAVQLR
jgi:hypothetical protein